MFAPNASRASRWRKLFASHALGSGADVLRLLFPFLFLFFSFSFPAPLLLLSFSNFYSNVSIPFQNFIFQFKCLCHSFPFTVAFACPFPFALPFPFCFPFPFLFGTLLPVLAALLGVEPKRMNAAHRGEQPPAARNVPKVTRSPAPATQTQRPALEPLLLALGPLTLTYPFSYLCLTVIPSFPPALEFAWRNPQVRSETSLDYLIST